MKKRGKKYNIYQRFYRSFKLNFIKLLRSPGGAKKVALGFAIGFGLEMLVISTACLIYILLFPLVKLARASLPAAIIGNVIGKLTFLPVLLIPFAKKIGAFVYPINNGNDNVQEHSLLDVLEGDFSVIKDLLHGGMHILIGMTIFGIIFGVISYYIISYLYNKERERRMTKKRSKTKRNISMH